MTGHAAVFRGGLQMLWVAVSVMFMPAWALAQQAASGCADKTILRSVEFQYQMALESVGKSSERVQSFADIIESAFGPPPKSVNQYATDVTFITETRFCKARLLLKSGASDTVVWRIDTMKDDGETSFRVDSCSLQFDPLKDGCEQWQPPK